MSDFDLVLQGTVVLSDRTTDVAAPVMSKRDSRVTVWK